MINEDAEWHRKLSIFEDKEVNAAKVDTSTFLCFSFPGAAMEGFAQKRKTR